MCSRLVAAAFALVVAGILQPPTARAQTAGMPTEIEWKLAEMGAVINAAATATLYAPLQEMQPYNDVRFTRDIKYGPAPRHELDLFTPAQVRGPPRPVLAFVHGGRFTGGNKRPRGSPFHDNIMLFAVRNGLIGVNVTYRLAPEHPWPAAAEDVAAAVRWVRGNIGAHGGDPERIVLMGHSSGAVHAASYVSHPEFHGPKGAGLAGAIFLSGLYDLTWMQLGPAERSYFGEDASKYPERSSIAGLTEASTPLMVVHAEFDPVLLIEQAKRLQDRLCKAGRCPRIVALEKHNHMSEVYAINTKDTALTDEILAFVKGGK